MTRNSTIEGFPADFCCAPVLATVRVEPCDYADPRIGNVVPLVKPTFPTFHQPDHILRMFPIKADYIVYEVEALPFLGLVLRKSQRSTGLPARGIRVCAKKELLCVR